MIAVMSDMNATSDRRVSPTETSRGPSAAHSLLFDASPASAGVGLLLLRVWLGGTMLLYHGWAKLSNFQAMSARFPDALHLGSPTASLAMSTFAEFGCAALIVLGIATRPAALFLVINMAVAFVVGHGMSLSGPRSGELAFVYLGGFLALLLTGAGRYSGDAVIAAKR